MCRVGKSIETQIDQWLPGAERRKQWGVPVKGYRFLSGDENVLELGRGDGCTTW